MAASIKIYMTNEEKPKKIIGIPEVPIAKSKKMQGGTGEIIYYIDKSYGIKNGLSSKMKFNNLLPINPKMCEITIEIDRI